MYEKFICPLTKKDIVEAVIAPDGITYERSALLKYVRKYKKSPVTGEKMDTSTLVFDENYIGSDENKAEDILNKVREEVSECIKLKKQFANFEQVPENIKISIVKNSENWKIIVESNDDEELPEKFMKNMEYAISNAYFQIKNDKHVFTSKHRGNGNIEIIGSKNIKNNENIVLTRFSSFTKENQVLNWLNNISANEITSKPLRIILGLDKNQELIDPIELDKSVLENELVTNLNEEQRKTFSNEYFKTLEIVEGPPGTGKTSTITILLDYIEKHISSKQKNHYILLVSEKNRGVDAVAERLQPIQYNKVLAFGSDNIGDFTKNYVLENKLLYHPLLIEKYNLINYYEEFFEKKIRKIKRLLFCHVDIESLRLLSWKNLGYMYYLISNPKNNIPNYKITKINKIIKEIEQNNQEYINIYKKLPELKKFVEKISKESCKIVLSTFGSLHQVSNFLKDVDNVSFSIIIDEASTLLNWQGFYLENFVNELGGSLINLIIIGDPKQLPPYWPDNENPNQEKESFLDLAINNNSNHSIQFVKQYRMPNQVMKILNKEYYKNNPLVLSHNRITKNEISWIHSDGCEKEENHMEAHMIVNTLKKLPKNFTIMIISPYKNQCEILTKICSTSLPYVKVMTLDSVQGHEADIVAVSLVKTNPTTFLTKKRTCVLVSRAKEQLLVFGNRQGCLACKNGALRRLARFSGIKK